MTESTNRTLTHADWLEEAQTRFGEDPMNWAFVCPSCGHIARVQEWKDVGAKEGEVAFSCVGRHLEGATEMCQRPGPCNYAGGGLLRLNPVTVTMPDGRRRETFEFAPAKDPQL